MRTLQGSRGMTLGVAAMIGAYTVLAVLAGAPLMLMDRLVQRGEMGARPFRIFTSNVVLVCWIICLIAVLAIPCSEERDARFFGYWAIHLMAMFAWLFFAVAFLFTLFQYSNSL
ncbi:MAG: hypothetical protein NTW19_13505 [Planctomycetota bacterium]|nr:hypothetical protein [Planctomycetota bacterium]